MHAPHRPRLTMLVVVAAASMAACGSSNATTSPPASRTVQVQMNDQLRFSPDSLAVKTGETVQFQVQNTGTMAHEFVVGDQHMQDQHEQAMQGMGGAAGMHGTITIS